MSSASENLRHSVREHLAKVQRGVLGLPDSPVIKLDAIKQARGLDKPVQIVTELEEGFSRNRILKVIETLRKHGAAVTSIAVAAELGLPAAMLYQDRDLLDAINAIARVDDLKAPPSNRLHKLKGNLKDFWSVSINNQWRIVFKWDDKNAIDVEIIDYH